MKEYLFMLCFWFISLPVLAQEPLNLCVNLGVYDNNGIYSRAFVFDTLLKNNSVISPLAIFSNIGKYQNRNPLKNLVVIINDTCSKNVSHIWLDQDEVKNQNFASSTTAQYAYHPIKINWKFPSKIRNILEVFVLPYDIFQENDTNYQNHPLTMHLRIKLKMNFFGSIELNIPYRPGKYEVRSHKRDYYRREVSPRKWKSVKRFRIKC